MACNTKINAWKTKSQLINNLLSSVCITGDARGIGKPWLAAVVAGWFSCGGRGGEGWSEAQWVWGKHRRQKNRTIPRNQQLLLACGTKYGDKHSPPTRSPPHHHRHYVLRLHNLHPFGFATSSLSYYLKPSLPTRFLTNWLRSTYN